MLFFRKFFDKPAGDLRRALAGLYAVLILANTGVWIWAFALFVHQPIFLGTALLAYTLGLRHAVDADHIAAIDNVTRKLMQEGKRPITVGFFFALGHSSVVTLIAMAVCCAAAALEAHFAALKQIGGIV